MLEEAGVPYKARFTGGSLNATALSYKSAAEGYRNFIAVGGDGTIHDVLNGIGEYVASAQGVSFSDFTLAVIPVGSGNDWVKSVGIPRDIQVAVKLIASGERRKQDVVKVSVLDASDRDADPVTVSYMANIAGVGLDARVCEIVNRKKEQGKRGKKLYVSALLYCIRHRVPVRASVVCDGVEIFNGKYLSIAFGTGKFSGGGMRQTPEAVMDDGLLDMTIIPELPIMKIAVEAPKLFTGKFMTVKELVTSRSREIIVIPYDEVLPCAHVCGDPVEVDGEVIGNAPVKFEVLPSQLNVLTL
jgi:YegS/Rv2252/BmrU family lipid kinase